MAFKKDLKILFIGDDIVLEGMKSDGFIDRLKKQMPHYNYIIKAVSGASMETLTQHFDLKMFKENFDCVFVMFSSLDLIKTRHHTLSTTDKMIRYHTNYQELVLSIFDSFTRYITLVEPFYTVNRSVHDVVRFAHQDRVYLTRSLAQEYRISMIALDGIMNEAQLNHYRRFVKNNGVLPTKRGHKLIYETIKSHLERWGIS